MEKERNAKTIEKQIKELKENIWKIEKTIGLQGDEFFIYNLIKGLEERINVIETILKLDQDSI